MGATAGSEEVVVALERRENPSARVVLVEDEKLLADALVATLPAHGLEVVAVAGTLEAGVAAVAAHVPQLVISDFRLPDGDVVDVLSPMLAAAADAKVLVYTGWADETGMLRALEGGASGYVEKSSSVHDFADAARRVLAGEVVVSPKLLGVLTRRAVNGATTGKLTMRELQILELVAAGRSTSEIAEDLFLSPNTVRNNVSRVLMKLDARTRLDAVRIGVARGLIRYDPPAR